MTGNARSTSTMPCSAAWSPARARVAATTPKDGRVRRGRLVLQPRQQEVHGQRVQPPERLDEQRQRLPSRPRRRAPSRAATSGATRSSPELQQSGHDPRPRVFPAQLVEQRVHVARPRQRVVVLDRQQDGQFARGRGDDRRDRGPRAGAAAARWCSPRPRGCRAPGGAARCARARCTTTSRRTAGSSRATAVLASAISRGIALVVRVDAVGQALVEEQVPQELGVERPPGDGFASRASSSSSEGVLHGALAGGVNQPAAGRPP